MRGAFFGSRRVWGMLERTRNVKQDDWLDMAVIRVCSSREVCLRESSVGWGGKEGESFLRHPDVVHIEDVWITGVVLRKRGLRYGGMTPGRSQHDAR